MKYACQIMLPLKYREAILDISGENRPIPQEDAAYFISYHAELDDIIKKDNHSLLRELIENRREIYEGELETLLNLDSKTLLLIYGLIQIEKKSKFKEGHA